MTAAIDRENAGALGKVDANLPSALTKATIAASLTALVLALWLQRQEPGRELFLSLNTWAAAHGPVGLWSFFTLLGEAGVLFCLLSPLLLLRPRAMFAVLAAVPLGAILSVSLKTLFQAARPAAVLDNTLFTVIGPLLHKNSFPSGHTLAAFSAALAVLACCVAPRKPGRNALIALVGLGLASCVGLSRIAVGAHWPVDVLAGAACGSLAGLSGAWLTGRHPALWQPPMLQFFFGQALFVTALWLLLHKPDLPQGVPAVWLAVASVLGTVSMQFIRLWPKKGR